MNANKYVLICSLSYLLLTWMGFLLQEWTLEDNTYIKHHDMCLTIPNTVPGTLVLMQPCEDGDNQVRRIFT